MPAGRWLIAVAVISTAFAGCGAWAAVPATENAVPLEVSVLHAPTPVAGAGRSHLAYELHLTNFGTEALRIVELDVLQQEAVLVRYAGEELRSVLQRVGTRAAIDTSQIEPGMRAVAALWVSPDGGSQSIVLRHRLVMADGRHVEGPAVVAVAEPAIILGPPLRGEWIAFGGAGAKEPHGQRPVALDGVVRNSQRFSIDWFQSRTATTEFLGSEQDTRQAYGADLLAVADAVVAAVRDGIPDNEIGHYPEGQAASTVEGTAGNYVLLDLGRSRFAFYAHLRPGSLRVSVGQRVRRGQVLGSLGLSGNTAYPHLHFQINAEGFPDSEALPYQFDFFEMRSEPGEAWMRLRNEYPMTPSGDPPRVRFAN